MPIILYFSQRITNRAAVERALQVTDLQAGDRLLVLGLSLQHGRHLRLLPAARLLAGRTTVSFTGHLNGVEGAPGVYGHHTLTQTFGIGQSVIAVA